MTHLLTDCIYTAHGHVEWVDTDGELLEVGETVLKIAAWATPYDFDNDGDCDLADYNAFLLGFTGPR